MERRIQRNKTSKVLKTWWSGLQKEKKKMTAYLRKRKRVPLYDQCTDEEIMGTVEEVKGTGVEKRGRRVYQDFAAFTDDMEDSWFVSKTERMCTYI